MNIAPQLFTNKYNLTPQVTKLVHEFTDYLIHTITRKIYILPRGIIKNTVFTKNSYSEVCDVIFYALRYLGPTLDPTFLEPHLYQFYVLMQNNLYYAMGY